VVEHRTRERMGLVYIMHAYAYARMFSCDELCDLRRSEQPSQVGVNILPSAY
jgi:hypothetical protein